MRKMLSLLLAVAILLAVLPLGLAENAPEIKVLSVTAHCTSEAYGQTIHAFTYELEDVLPALKLTTADFMLKHAVYDAMETHEPFEAQATKVYVSGNTLTVGVEPFYPRNSFTKEGYWALESTLDALDVDAASEISISDPVVEAFVPFTKTLNTARLECYLYSPANASAALPLVIFNSGGSGISTTNDAYGANFVVSFGKAEIQSAFPCYVLYPQRNAGETDDLCAAIVEIANDLVAEGKVDANRIYMTGESAGSSFTMNFVSRYPGFNAAIAIFNGGANFDGIAGSDKLEDTLKVEAGSPWSDAELKQLADSGTKVMFVQSIGDTTSTPIRYATAYQKLIGFGMKPGNDLVWRYYTAQDFNVLCMDRTEWKAMADAGYVTDPITGITTYYYPEGKLHNSSYPAANDLSIKMWLFNQQKGEYVASFVEEYSAVTKQTLTDYAMIPEYYTKVATLEGAPGVPAGSTTTLTVYTNDEETLYYISFQTFFKPDPQFVEGMVVGSLAHVIMDCSGTWWTADAENFMLPYIVAQENIDWQPYVR